MRDRATRRAYWRANLRYLLILLAIWFAVSYGCGILFVDQLDRIRIGGFRLGFWFAQQGSIYVFVLLIFVYVWLMNRLDRRFGRGRWQRQPFPHPGDPRDHFRHSERRAGGSRDPQARWHQPGCATGSARGGFQLPEPA